MGVRGRDGAREGSTKEVRVCFFPSLLFSVHVVVRMGAAGENAVLLRCLRLVRGCAQREKEKRGTEQRWKKQRTKKSINKGTWVSPVCFSLQRQYKKVTAQCTGAAKVRVRQRRRERQSHSGREREREREQGPYRLRQSVATASGRRATPCCGCSLRGQKQSAQRKEVRGRDEGSRER